MLPELNSLQLYLVTIVLVLSLLFWIYSNNRSLPPGPWGVPIFGFAPFLGKKPHITMSKLTQKYGGVIRFNFMGKHVVALTTYKAINEALVKQSDVFSIRPHSEFPQMKEYRGVISNSGEMWADFRRFTLSTLRDFGFGKTSLEPQIRDEIYHFITEVKALQGKPAVVGQLLQKSVTNVICAIMTGHRYDYSNEVFNKLLVLTGNLIKRSGIGRIERLLPKVFIESRFAQWFGFKSILETRLQKNELLSQVVERYDQRHRMGSTENFIDAWLTMSKKENSKYFTKKHLIGVLSDLFIAGSDTTSNTLQWGLLYMAQYPEIQQNVQREIDEVIGKEKDPTMLDQKQMPYTEATLMEISRIATIVPLSLPHSTSKSTTLLGYHIPKGTTIFPNLWAVHHDPDIFPDPEAFQPERFLVDEKQLKRMNEFLPFSTGRRQCLGESLARMELFLYFTCILQQFSVKNPDGMELDFDYNSAVVSQPRLQNLCLIPRL